MRGDGLIFSEGVPPFARKRAEKYNLLCNPLLAPSALVKEEENLHGRDGASWQWDRCEIPAFRNPFFLYSYVLLRRTGNAGGPSILSPRIASCLCATRQEFAFCDLLIKPGLNLSGAFVDPLTCWSPLSPTVAVAAVSLFDPKHDTNRRREIFIRY